MKAMFQIVWFNTTDYIVPPTLGVLNKHAVLHSFPGLQLGLVRPPRGLLCWFTHTFQQHLSHAQFHWSNRKVIKLEVLIKVQFFFLCEVCLIKILSLSYTIKIHANTSAFAKLSQQYETHLSRWALCRQRQIWDSFTTTPQSLQWHKTSTLVHKLFDYQVHSFFICHGTSVYKGHFNHPLNCVPIEIACPIQYKKIFNFMLLFVNLKVACKEL